MCQQQRLDDDAVVQKILTGRVLRAWHRFTQDRANRMARIQLGQRTDHKSYFNLWRDHVKTKVITNIMSLVSLHRQRQSGNHLFVKPCSESHEKFQADRAIASAAAGMQSLDKARADLRHCLLTE